MTETIEILVDPADPASLDGLADRILEGISDGLVEFGEDVAESARDQAPLRSGALAGSITFRSADPLEGHVGSPLEYASVIEFGSSTTEPQPFMLPALEDNEPRFGIVMADAIRSTTGGI